MQTGRCIVRRGNTQIRMAEVAVTRPGCPGPRCTATFQSRDDLLLGLMLTRIDTALADLVRGLRHPDDPVRSLPEMVLVPVVSVEGNPLNEALFAGGSAAVATALEMGSEPIVELLLHHYEPLLQRWRHAGRLHEDLDYRAIVEWLNATTLSCWRRRGGTGRQPDKRQFVEQFLVRALVPQIRQ